MLHNARKIFQKSEFFFALPVDAEKYWARGVPFAAEMLREKAGCNGKSSERSCGIDANRVYFAPISPIPKLNQSGSVITAAIDVASTICTAIFG